MAYIQFEQVNKYFGSNHVLKDISLDVNQGELVTFLAAVNHVGRTSMEIGIKVVAENIHSRVSRHTNSCYFSMVAVDELGKPVTVPHFAPANDEERARFAKAERRKALRRALAEEDLH